MPDMVIALANEAICLADPADPNLVKVYSDNAHFYDEITFACNLLVSFKMKTKAAKHNKCLKKHIITD